MPVFDFKAILNQVDVNESEADSLYARCKDGTLITDGGTTYIDFGRHADSLDLAVRTAIADINAAGFRVVRVEIEADSVIAQKV